MHLKLFWGWTSALEKNSNMHQVHSRAYSTASAPGLQDFFDLSQAVYATWNLPSAKALQIKSSHFLTGFLDINKTRNWEFKIELKY